MMIMDYSPEDGAHLCFSLKRAILAHGWELNPDNKHNFVLDARDIDPSLPSNEQKLQGKIDIWN